MASGAQVSEEAGSVGREFDVASSNQVSGEPGEVAARGEIGVASSNQVAEGTEGVGGPIGVSPTNQVTGEAGRVGGVIEGGDSDPVIEKAGGVGGEIGAVQVTQVGGLDGKILVPLANQITREPEGAGGEIGVASVDHITQEPEGLGAEITEAFVNHVKGEAGASDGEIKVTSVNHEMEEAGALGADIKVVSVNQMTEETEPVGSEFEVVFASQVNGEPAGVGGEIGVASADSMNEPGGRSGKLEIASANEVYGEPGGGVGEVGVPSAIQVNGKPEGQIGIGITSVNQVNEEPGGLSGESGVASVNQVNEEPGGLSGESGVASVNQLNAEQGGKRGESGVASSNQMNGQPGGEGEKFGVASPIQVNGEPGGSSEIGLASANQMNEEPGGNIGLAAANQVNGEPGGDIGLASANQVNGVPGGGIGLASANQVNREPGNYIELASADKVNRESGGNIELASANQVNGEPGSVDGEIRVASLNQVNGVSRRVGGDLRVGEKHSWVETKVYRRRPKGEKNKGVLSDLTPAPATKTPICNANGNQNNKIIEAKVVESEILVPVPASGDNPDLMQIQPETLGEVISRKEFSSARMDGTTPILVDPSVTNGSLRPSDSSSVGKVKINLASTAKPELRELKRKFESELYSVRKAVKRMNGGREEVIREFFNPVLNSIVLPNGVRSNGFATRVYSGSRSLGHVPYKPNIRPFNQLRVSVVENGHGMVDSIEREKRTPKANQFYRNSEFLLANDKFPPAESNKKSKSNGKRSSGGEFGFGVGSKVYKSCSALLEKLMKHKHGWVFNAPVDVKGLGLHDYFLIIKNPMDLGTVKAKLIKYWYKSPMEFAEDVRLTFHNAMLYNPKGHDVHIMAETLLKIFEGKWPDIEVKYLRELRMAVEPDMGYPTPTSRMNNPFQSPGFPPLETRTFNRSESMPQPVNPKPRTLTPAPSFRAPALKKPKAKDVNKRDMTYDEKQKLSTNLQSLPPEKLDGVIQIIKKRSTALSQNDDEIEVDIDSVDTETLWELDRFVTNYKKSLSKNRRKAELANQMRAEARQAAEKMTAPQPLPPKESIDGYGNTTSSLPPHQNDPAANASGSSSSSSSSSSGSSSSDSDSDSSSEESDGERSRGT